MKKLTTGQRLAFLLRTAVVEAQAVEAGRHPNITLDMGEYALQWRDGPCAVCLGGVYAMMALGKGPHMARVTAPSLSYEEERPVTAEELALDSLRAGYVNRAAVQLGIEPLPEPAALRISGLIDCRFDHWDSRADWDTYLEAADILERAQ